MKYNYLNYINMKRRIPKTQNASFDVKFDQIIDFYRSHAKLSLSRSILL